MAEAGVAEAPVVVAAEEAPAEVEEAEAEAQVEAAGQGVLAEGEAAELEPVPSEAVRSVARSKDRNSGCAAGAGCGRCGQPRACARRCGEAG